MGMMLKNLVHPYIQSTTVLCDISTIMKVIRLIVIGFWTLLTKASMSLLLVKFYMHTYVRSETYVITCASSLLRPLPMQVDYVQGREGVM